MPRRRSNRNTAPRGTIFLNQDGSPSVFDNFILPAAAKKHADATFGAPAAQGSSRGSRRPVVRQGNVSFNPNFAGSEIDLQQRSFQRQEAQQKKFQQESELAALRDNLLNPPLSADGSIQKIASAATGGGGAPTVPVALGRDTTAEDLTGEGIIKQVNAGFGIDPGAVINNRFAQPDNTAANLNDKQSQRLADAIEPFNQAEALQAASDAAAIGQRMRNATPSQKESLQQQYLQKWGKFAARGIVPVEMTSEQAAELKKEIKVKQLNSSAKTIMEGGTPDQLLFADAKGNVSIPPGLRDVISMQSQRDSAKAKAEADKFKADAALRKNRMKAQNSILDNKLKQLDLAENNVLQPGEEASPEELRSFNEQLSLLNRDRMGLINQKNQLLTQQFPGEEPQQREAPQPPPTVETQVRPDSPQFVAAQQLASESGIELVSDRDDFEALEPGEQYVDAADGETYTK